MGARTKSGVFIGRLLRLGRRAKLRIRLKKAREHHIVKYPWEKTAIEKHHERIDMHKVNMENPNKKLKRMRAKFPGNHRPTTIGPGYPVFGLIYANMDIARGERRRKVLLKTASGTPIVYEPLKTELPHPVPENVFDEYCRRIGIEPYKAENDEKENENPSAIDVGAFDLYWEDIRIERNIILHEYKHLPKEGLKVEDLEPMEKAMINLAKACYYSPITSHKKCEDVVHIFVWLLNKNALPVAFHIKLLQAMSMMIYHSAFLKLELVKCGGMSVLYKSMQIGLIICPIQAAWACYTLTMGAIGSPEIIAELRKISDFDETIGELTLSLYWYYWPTNFACILQGIVAGPGGIAISDDIFSFL